MGKSNTEQLKIAQKYLGQGGATFRKYCGLPSGAAWCDAFITYIFNEAGNASLFCGGKKQTYCPTTIKLCAKNMAQIPMYLAMPSDVIFFDWERNGVPNHIGLVRSKVSTSTINTIEGNTSNKVMNKTRPAKYVQAIYRPAFKGSYKLGKLTVDGECGYNTIAGLQKLVGAEIDAILGINTVKKTQAYCGVKNQDGAWGPATSKAFQSKMAKEGYYTGKIDGEFGKQSVIGMQKLINAKCFMTTTPAPAPQPTPTPTPAKYTGAFPDLVVHSGQKIAYTARDLAYAKGTKKATYTYGKGKAKAAFTKAINAVYPKRSSWSKQCQAGASCDVGAGTIIRYSGVDTKIPRGLEEQIPHLKKSTLWKKTTLTKTSQMIAGDVGVYIGKTKGAHIWIGLGGGLIAEANHTANYFEHVDTDNYTSANKKTWGIYRATKASVIVKGDRGTEVKKLQNFLNWSGFNCGAADGEFGDNTLKAVKAFQTKVGIDADGIVGNGTITKMKVYAK